MSRINGHLALRRLIGIVAAFMLIAPTSSAGSVVTATPPPPVAIPGHVLSNLAAANRVASLPSSQPLTLTVALRPSSPGALDRAIALARSQPDLPQLAPEAFGQLYGQPQSQIDAVAAFFQSAGFAVQPPAADHLTIKVSGTAGQVEKTLGVSLDNYVDAAGRPFFATSSDPSLPANLIDSVQAIYGLDNYPAFRPLFMVTQGSPGTYVPKDLQTAYNITPLYTAGFTGAGQTIAIVGCDSFLASDIQAFEQDFQLPIASISQTNVDGGPNGPSTSGIETTLDLEWASGIATGATLHYYGFNCSFQGFLDTMTAVVNDNTASVVSVSLGACESTYSSSNYLTPIENELGAAAAKSQGIFVASGDLGAYCASNSAGVPTTFGVSYPASSSNVTAVGGTTLATTINSAYSSESAWGSATGCTGPPPLGLPSPCGSGGGKSTALPEPAWQSAAGIPSTGGQRGVPDIALNADPMSGDVIWFTLNNSLGTPCTPCGGIGGTSIATPQWAGLEAIANQAAGRRLGQFAPLLYGSNVTSRQSPSCATYHDVTTGNNLFYTATTGWDFTTGWGSTNAYNLLRALVPSIPRLAQSVASESSSPAASIDRFTGSAADQIFIPLVFMNWVAC